MLAAKAALQTIDPVADGVLNVQQIDLRKPRHSLS
jgi:hypothetical protein